MQKMLIIGVDGVTGDVLMPSIEEKKLPTLRSRGLNRKFWIIGGV